MWCDYWGPGSAVIVEDLPYQVVCFHLSWHLVAVLCLSLQFTVDYINLLNRVLYLKKRSERVDPLYSTMKVLYGWRSSLKSFHSSL